VSDLIAGTQKTIHNVFLERFDKFIYQLENTIVDGGNNYHYQGYGHVKGDKQRPKSLAISLNGQINGVEVRASSTAGIEALKSYSMKADTRVGGPWADGSRYLGEDLITNLYPWQEEIKRAVSERPDDRSINCIINPGGSIGKSAFCKYMAYHMKTLVLGWGKTGDLLNLVSQFPNRQCYLFDLAKSRPQDFARDDIASAMEGIKNGLFINTKYQTCQVLMRCPHIWIFTNSVPNLSSMSADRWRLWEIDSSRTLVRLSSARLAAIRKAEQRAVSPKRSRVSAPRDRSGRDSDDDEFPFPV